MNRRAKISLGIGALAAVFIFVGIWARALKPKTLQDFEQRCKKAADTVQRQKIALDAVNFLIQRGVPDSIAEEIHQAALKEKITSVPESELVESNGVAMNDSVWALYETRLKEFLLTIFQLKKANDSGVIQTKLAAARNLAQKVDAYTKYGYWVPLLNFLAEEDSTAWYCWRTAAMAAANSRAAYEKSEFELARLYAIHGLRKLSGIPDRRLYLDLCLRLQNAMAYDRDACFSLALAFGKWIAQECLRAKYYLRAASIDYNLGDQLYRTGQDDEAIEKLKNVLNLAARSPHFADMKNWYQPWTHERLALTLREIGEYQTALHHIEIFGQTAKSPREKALYHMGIGLAVKGLGEYEKAEREYFKSIESAKDEDIANVWYAHYQLAELFLEYDLPEKSLKYLEEGKLYAESRVKDFFDNNERMSYYLILKTKALLKQEKTESARETLRQAEESIQALNSSKLYVEQSIAAAELHESLDEFEEAGKRLAKALEYCRAHGHFFQELRVTLKQAELSARTNVVKPVYPAEALSNVIRQLQKIGDNPQLIRAHALLSETAYKAGQMAEARRQADLLLEKTEALSRQYEQEERLIFFQHSIYKDIKAAIQFDILCGRLDSAFVKLSYVKGRALRGKLMAESPTPYFDIAGIQKNLQNNEAILNYMITADTLYVFVLKQAALQLWRIPENKQHLQAKVDAYISYLKDDEALAAANQEKQFHELFARGIQLSNELYQAVFEPMARELGDVDHLFIIPDEVLYAVPFNALALTNKDDARFLIENKAIMVLSGAWILTTRPDKNTTQDHANLLASIDSDMPGADKIESRLRAIFENEAKVWRQWEDKNSFKKHLAKNYSAYLFYAHAEANWDEPRESYIEFSANSPGHQDRLSYQDVDSLDWRKAALVILAGCETSGNRIYLGAGLTGLQRAFLAAGASQVLATYWKVDAMQVADQIPRFLEAWRQHHDALRALQAMQKMAIKELRNDPFFKYPHPQLWGAYNLTGAKVSVGEAMSLVAN